MKCWLGAIRDPNQQDRNDHNPKKNKSILSKRAAQ